ncbi:MAG: hypothetical protein WC851_00295 [Candidatus Shapirobacteria bacterium]|jgi:hypothetical protein
MKKKRLITSSSRDYQELYSYLHDNYKDTKLDSLSKVFLSMFIVSTAVISLFLLPGNNRLFSSILFPTSTTLNDISKISKLEDSVKKLSTAVESINNNLIKDPTNTDLKKISIRMSGLESSQEALTETILENPDKALTSKLIREKQIMVENGVAEIKSNLSKLNDRLDNIVTALVAIPLGGFVLSLVSTLIYFLINKGKTHSAKNKILKKR